MAEPRDGVREIPVGHANPVTRAGYTMIPNGVMLRAHLSAEAKLIYGYMSHLAWRNNFDGTDPPRAIVAADLGLTEKKVTAALKELGQEPTLAGDATAPGLIVTVRRGQGRTNVYVINDPEEAPAVIDEEQVDEQRRAHRLLNEAIRRGKLTRQPCAVCGKSKTDGHHEDYSKPLDVIWLCRKHHVDLHVSRKAVSAFLEEQGVAFPTRARQGSDPKRTTEEKKPPSPLPADAPADDPPKLRKIDGRDIALDTLCRVCAIDLEGSGVRHAVVALNGRGTQKGIRQLFWIECRRYTDSHNYTPEQVEEIRGEFETALALRIEYKADMIRERQSWRTITPTAVRDLWLDIEQQEARAGGGLSPEQIETFGAQIRNGS